MVDDSLYASTLLNSEVSVNMVTSPIKFPPGA